MEGPSSFAIKSRNIVTHPEEAILSGYILIKGEKIHEVVPLGSAPEDFERKLKEEYCLIDYSDLYVFPGLIEVNTSLGCDFGEEWQDNEGTTKMALKGGVTVIFDNPLFDKPVGKSESWGNCMNRASALAQNIYTDVGLISKIAPQNVDELDSLISSELLLGLRIYLAPTPALTELDSESENIYHRREEILKKTRISLERAQADLPVLVSSMLANERDLFMASPCRRESLEKRSDLDYDIKSLASFGGGHHGNSKSYKELLKLLKEPEEKQAAELMPKSIFSSLKQREEELEFFSPSSAQLNKISQNLTTFEEQKSIADLELSEYAEPFELSVGNLLQEQPQMKELFDINFSPQSKLDSDEDPSTSQNKLDTDKSLQNFTSCASFDSEVSTSIQMRKLSDISSPLEDSSGSPSRNTPSALLQRRSLKSSPDNSRLKNSVSAEADLVKFCAASASEETMSCSKLKRPLGLSKINTSSQREKPKDVEKEANYSFYLSNHPVSWENNGAALVLKSFDGMKNGKIFFTNLSAISLAFIIRSAGKQKDLKVFIDCSAPFLHFHSKRIKPGCTILKSSPPIRDKTDRNLLITSCRKGIFNTVSAFHLQVPEKYKYIGTGSIRRAFSGLCSIGYTLQLTWTKFYLLERYKLKKHQDEAQFQNKLQHALKMLVKLLSSDPAAIMNVASRKGAIKKGLDADLCIWDPFSKTRVEDDDVLFRYKKVFIYSKEKFYGEVRSTFLRGRLVYDSSAKEDSERFFRFGKVLSRCKNSNPL